MQSRTYEIFGKDKCCGINCNGKELNEKEIIDKSLQEHCRLKESQHTFGIKIPHK